MEAPALLIGEPLALDLINTLTAKGDLLTAPAELQAWLALESDRFTEGLPERISEKELAAVRCVRELAKRVVECLRSDMQLCQKDLDSLNEILLGSPCVLELKKQPAGVSTARRRLGSESQQIAARLAEALAELVANPAASQIRQCEADDCVMLFLPAHPRRRWCSASRCGNRMRVARHYQRNKSE